MSQIETAVTHSRNLETLLADKLQATGRGLHEKLSSVETALPADLVKQLRFIATMRNSVVHEADFQIPDLPGFVAAAEAAAQRLHTMQPSTAVQPSTESPVHAPMRLGTKLYLAGIVLGAVAGGGMGIAAGGVGAGVVSALGGGFIVLLAFSDDAIRLYKSVLEIVLGLFIIGAILATLGFAVACLSARGTTKPTPAHGTTKGSTHQTAVPPRSRAHASSPHDQPA